MKTTITFLILIGTLIAVKSQEPLPRADAIKFATLLNFDLGKLSDTPIPTDADVKRPFGLRAENRGGLVVPETKLSAATFAKAGKDPVPVGQLWLAGLVPVRNGQPAARHDLKHVTVQYEGRDATLPLCLLGIRRAGDSRLELLVYGQEREPLIAAPLTKVTQEQTWPIELSAQPDGNASARVTLTFLGEYEASILVAAPME